MDNRIKEHLEQLESEINDQGWDGAPKIWILAQEDDALSWQVLGKLKPGDHPADHLEMMAGFGARLPANVLGLAVINEGWAHPEYILKEMVALKDNPGEAAKFYKGLGAPSSYEDRQELRICTIAFRDGTTAGFTRFRERPEIEWNDQETQMGGRVVDSMRAMFGLEPIPIPWME